MQELLQSFTFMSSNIIELLYMHVLLIYVAVNINCPVLFLHFKNVNYPASVSDKLMSLMQISLTQISLM